MEGGYQNQFSSAFQIELAHLPLRLVVVYVNYLYLFPKFLEKADYLRYVLLTVLSIAAASFLQRFLMWDVFNPLIFPGWHNTGNFALYRILQAAMLLTAPLIFIISFTAVNRWTSLVKHTEILAREKKQAELELLKNQLNPHFFFNTLNTLYGLAQEKSDRTEQVILQLSDLMNYVLYEADQELVPLEKEVRYIRSYIELEEIRYGDRFSCAFSLSGAVDSVRIPPMLLLPFVENAFKHGVNRESRDSWINMTIEAENRHLYFRIENSLAKFPEHENGHSGGIGIRNVRKRLELLYPGRHALEYRKNDTSYEVTLEIQLEN